MPGLLDGRGGFDDPLTMGLLGASQALLTHPSQGGGLGAAFAAFPAAQQAMEQRRMRELMQAYQIRKLQQEDEDRQAARDLDTQIKNAARNAFVQPSPGSLGGGIAPGSQQGRMLLESMSGDPEFDKANLSAINGAANTVGPKEAVSLPTQGGFDQNRFFNELMQVSPLQAMKLRKDMQGESQWAKIDPRYYTPESVSEFARTQNPAVLRAAADADQFGTRDTGTAIEYFLKNQPDKVVHRVEKSALPNWQPVVDGSGNLTVVNSRDATAKAVQGQDGAPVPKPLKEMPATVANGYIENQVALGKINEAISAVQTYPNALGLMNKFGDDFRQRSDPQGVTARAMIADIGSLKIHERSGAAVTAAESPRLSPFIPKVTDTPDTAIKKLKQFKVEYEKAQAEIQSFYGEGYKQPPKAPPAAVAGAPAPQPQSAPQAQPQPTPGPQGGGTPTSGLGTQTVSGTIGGPKIATMADIARTAAASGRTTEQVTKDLRDRGFIIR